MGNLIASALMMPKESHASPLSPDGSEELGVIFEDFVGHPWT
jgi:hypothetical protein